MCLLPLATVGCFEDAPLEAGSDTGDLGSFTTRTEEPTGGDETAGATDGPTADATSAGDPDAVGGGSGDVTIGPTPCESDEECAALDDADLCNGIVRCLDGTCDVDATTIPFCPPPADPCFDNGCVPESGACYVVDTCACQPLGVALGCGTKTSFSPFDPGLTGVVEGYSCGDPAVGAGPEHVLLFTAQETETVLVEILSGEAAGVRVLADGEQGCEPDECVGSGDKGAAFAAIAGRTYAVVLEHEPGEASLVEIGMSCGVLAETDCDDGIDDDGNGLTDCDEAACLGVGDCPALKETECDDGVDEDKDGLTDCDDPSCSLISPCLEICQAGALGAYCGFNQGGTTGGGKTNASTYACDTGPAPDSPGKEVVHAFSVSEPTTVSLSLSSGAGAVLYVLADEGLGCTPVSCIDWGTSGVTFTAHVGVDYFFVIDSPSTTAALYDFDVDCVPQR